MSLPILYSSLHCPFSTRARLALSYAGVRCELREVDSKNKPPEMVALMEKARAPMLLLADGSILAEGVTLI